MLGRGPFCGYRLPTLGTSALEGAASRQTSREVTYATAVGKLREGRTIMRVLGPVGLLRESAARLGKRRLACHGVLEDVLSDARVLEFGGPSAVFEATGPVPVYGVASAVDNVNYAGATLWESDLEDGGVFAPGGRPLGRQWIREAVEPGSLGPYDVLVTSHTIEHVANPLRALRAWQALVRPDGHLVLLLPHRDATFDHRRPITPLQHLLEDESHDVDESDATHAEEILRLHDLRRDEGVASREELEARVADNLQTRSMHHHVFSTRSALDMVAESGWHPVFAEAVWPHIVLVARKSAPSGRVAIVSPFASDR